MAKKNIVKSSKDIFVEENNDIIEDFMNQYQGPDSFADLFQNFKKKIVERIVNAELDNHLGYQKHEKSSEQNSRNGSYSRTLITDTGTIDIDMPRDRDASFDPKFIKKGQRRFEGFDDKIISMYGRGMSMKEIQGHIYDMYGTEVSAEFISSVTDAVIDEVTMWQNRSLESIYPILYLDAIHIKVRENNQIINKALYLAIGVNMDGKKETLGMWLSKSEGAKFWLSVVTDLKNRGVEKIFIACIDGLKGFGDAINSVFPETIIQLCIVHQVRNSLKYVPYKDMKKVASDLREIYGANSEDSAKLALESFKEKWDNKYPMISASWENNWPSLVPFLAFPGYIRKAIYTTNVIESVNRQIRKIIKSKGSFPNDQAVLKLVYLALKNAQKSWTMPIRDWKLALNQFSILFDLQLTHNF